MAVLTYFGHSAVQIESNDANILIDPFISENPLAPVSKEELKPDYIIITHGHGDHIGDAVEIAKASNSTVIANYEIANYFQKKGVKSAAMHIGGRKEFPFGTVKFTIAHHGSGLDTPDEGMIYMGNPCGVIVSVDGKNIYHAGDTGLFLDMKLIGEITNLDIALLPIGDNFTMGIEDAVRAADFLKAKLNIPIHYNTFDLIKADPEDFAAGLEALNLSAKTLNPGDSIEI
ncbi:MAG: metal-dependent hydrolase [Candidatus Marinimicrobia bacterium]|nr:metal-dependent hydrolase [Candidatus Neomarinimicrobiota bacterium]